MLIYFILYALILIGVVMDCRKKQKFGKAAKIAGIAGLLLDAPIVLAAGLSTEPEAPAKAEEVAEARQALYECWQNNYVQEECERRESRYEALVTGSENIELLVHADRQAGLNGVGLPFAGIALGLYFGGRMLQAEGKNEEFEKRLKEKE